AAREVGRDLAARERVQEGGWVAVVANQVREAAERPLWGEGLTREVVRSLVGPVGAVRCWGLRDFHGPAGRPPARSVGWWWGGAAPPRDARAAVEGRARSDPRNR